MHEVQNRGLGISPKLKKARRQNQLVYPSPTFFNIACVRTHAKLATRRGWAKKQEREVSQRSSERLHFAKNNQKTFFHFAKTIKRQFY